MALSRIKRATLAAAAGVAVLGGTLAAAPAASASANSCGNPAAVLWNGGASSQPIGCGTLYGSWWATIGIQAGGHTGVASCNDYGTIYPIQFNYKIRSFWPTRHPNDECTEIWIAS